MAKWSDEVNKKVGRDIIVTAGDIVQMPRIPTGSLSLDVETGGGIPIGRISTFSGDYSDGKTAVVLKIVAQFQRLWPEKEVVWIDAEGSWDTEWARALGVIVEKITLVYPDYSEQAFDIAQKAVMNDVGLVVIDSMAALSPRNEAESDMETNTVALQARLNKKFMRKTQGALYDFNGDNIPPTVILINQLYKNIGGYGPQDREGGGSALEYFPALKVRLRAGKLYPESKSVNDEGVEPKAQAIRFFTEKNKTAPRHRRGHFWFYFDHMDKYRPKGCYDRLEEVIRYGMKLDIIKKRGSVFDIPNPDNGEIITLRGSNALAEYIRDNQDVQTWLEKQVMEGVNGKGTETVQTNESGEGTSDTKTESNGGGEE